MKKIGLTFIICIMLGCASIGKNTEGFAKLESIASGEARVFVYRPSESSLTVAEYCQEVILSSVIDTCLKPNRYTYVDLPAGTYLLESKAERFKYDTSFELALKSGDEVMVYINNGEMPRGQYFLTLLGVLMGATAGPAAAGQISGAAERDMMEQYGRYTFKMSDEHGIEALSNLGFVDPIKPKIDYDDWEEEEYSY